MLQLAKFIVKRGVDSLEQKPRYHLLDSLRAIALINMIAYHAMFDIVYIFGVRAKWYMSKGSDIWQMFICCTFIILSGFCWQLGGKKLKRGLLVLGGSAIIMLVTVVFMPSQKILFGVLSLIGSAMIIMIPLHHVFKRINPFIGAVISVLLYTMFRNINHGGVYLFNTMLFALPQELYANNFTAYLGFPPFMFSSSDYFPLLPWIFLYFAGYFLYGVFVSLNLLRFLKLPRIKPLEWIGRNSLIIYMLHQPVVYGVLYVIFEIL